MATAAGAAAGAVFVGRTSEVEQVRSVVDDARAGRMRALLVSGDAGVGKTRLVARACAEGEPADLLVLDGVCLPMAATTVPLMPLRTALRRMPADVRAPDLTPGRAGAGPVDPVPVVVDEWLEELCRDRPVVLVVDDVQWADEGSLDVLTYLLAGPVDRRLAVLMTLRGGEVGPGHPVQRWLADVRRMPSLTELSLSAFDRAATREQLGALLGAPPYESLVTDVHTRTGGNAYLNRLLAEDLPADARHLAEGLPDDLRGAVLRPWHRLSTAARELVLAMAVGGEVAAGRALGRAAALSGTAAPEVPRLLREAVDVGVLDVTPDGGYWFHHPLQAEALESFLAGEERRRMHAAFAAACEADLVEDGAPTPARLAAVSAIAEHHARSEHVEDAYQWTREAARLAERLGDGPAQLAQLRRLVVLRPGASRAEEPLPELLDRLRRVAAALGDHEAEHGAVVALLDAVSPLDQPLLAAELLVRCEHLRFSTGRGFLRVESARRAVDLSSGAPDSWQHAYALAELAQSSLWADEPDAAAAVERALQRAEACGEPRALAYALAAASMAASFSNRPGGRRLGSRGVEQAVVARDWWAFVHATLWEANGSDSWGTLGWADLVRGRRLELERLGGPHPYAAWLAADEAGARLGVGDPQGCADCLRVALGSDPGTAADVTARLAAARLAAYQGRQSEAEDHLARADELFAETTGFLAFEFDAVRAQVRLGAGDPRGAYEAALTGATSPGVPPTLCEWLCPLAARALADLAATAGREGRDPQDIHSRLDDLLVRFPTTIPDSALLTPLYRSQLAALDALYAAEVARARRAPDEVERWREAASRLEDTFPWDAAYAALRAGEVLLVRGGSREDAAAHLRRARALATRLGMEPVLREVHLLAASARIRLDEVAPSPSEVGVPALNGLTAREREVLGHVVAGRTYREIARALFVSEKTVSSHISNLLRKTGTGNRIELARLARHAGGG